MQSRSLAMHAASRAGPNLLHGRQRGSRRTTPFYRQRAVPHSARFLTLAERDRTARDLFSRPWRPVPPSASFTESLAKGTGTKRATMIVMGFRPLGSRTSPHCQKKPLTWTPPRQGRAACRQRGPWRVDKAAAVARNPGRNDENDVGCNPMHLHHARPRLWSRSSH